MAFGVSNMICKIKWNH